MDDSVAYHTSKYTKKFCIEVRFLHIMWLVQSPDLNHIKNRIIKIQVSSCCYQIHSVKEMRVVISEE